MIKKKRGEPIYETPCDTFLSIAFSLCFIYIVRNTRGEGISLTVFQMWFSPFLENPNFGGRLNPYPKRSSTPILFTFSLSLKVPVRIMFTTTPACSQKCFPVFLFAFHLPGLEWSEVNSVSKKFLEHFTTSLNLQFHPC